MLHSLFAAFRASVFTIITKNPVRIRLVRMVRREIAKSGPPIPYPKAMNTMPAPTSPLVNMPMFSLVQLKFSAYVDHDVSKTDIEHSVKEWFDVSEDF